MWELFPKIKVGYLLHPSKVFTHNNEQYPHIKNGFFMENAINIITLVDGPLVKPENNGKDAEDNMSLIEYNLKICSWDRCDQN